MQRSKPRYPLALDNAFCDTVMAWEVPHFQLETYFIGIAVLAAGGAEISEDDYDRIARMLAKISMTYEKLPNLTVMVQAKIDS